MDFHWWMLLPLIPLMGIGLLAFKVVRIRRRGRRFLQLSHEERLEFARLVLRDRDLPVIPRVLVALAAGYLALPIDLIPDFIPIVGHADDFLVVTVLLALITRMMAPAQLEAIIERVQLTRADRRAIPVN